MKFSVWVQHSLLLAAVEVSTAMATATSTGLPIYNVPEFALADLASLKQTDQLKQILGQTGLFAIRVPLRSQTTMVDPLQQLCPYSQSLAEGSIPGSDHVLLADGITTRSTIATASHGTHSPLSLPQDEIISALVSHRDLNLEKKDVVKEVRHLEETRDIVSMAVTDGFLPSLDHLLQKSNTNNEVPLLTKSNGMIYTSMQEIVEDAVHLEHFHIYDKAHNSIGVASAPSPDTSSAHALDWHTDAGLFLAFLPASSCDNTNAGRTAIDDDSFRVMVPSSTYSNNASAKEHIARFPTANSNEMIVAIMLGTGAEHWLDVSLSAEGSTEKSLQLRATKHSVKMRPGHKRVWYGKMYLVSSQAFVHKSPEKSYTLSDIRNSVPIHSTSRQFGTENNSNEIPIGCGSVSETPPTLIRTFSASTSSRRRRLQHGVEPSACTNSVNGSDFYCWMQCLSSSNENINPDESLYCVNLAVLAKSKDLKKAIAACTDEKGVVGGVMDDGCENVWHPTIDEAFTHVTDDTSHSSTTGQSDGNKHDESGELAEMNELYQEKYCYGATAMYMQGFEWEGTTCIVYLFQTWIITTRGAFIAACLGTILFGIFVEVVVKQRRIIVDKFTKPLQKLVVSTLMYGIQLTNGYLIMLVVMTYSGPLVLCVVLGLMCGHIVCNLTMISKNQTKDGSETTIALISGTTPCCVSEKDLACQKTVATSHTPISNSRLVDTNDHSDDDSEVYDCCCADGEEKI